MEQVRVAAVQMETVSALTPGLDRIEERVVHAVARGARLVAFGETVLPGYPAWLDVCRDAGLWDHAPVKAAWREMSENAVTVPGPATRRLAHVAKAHGIVLVIGVVERVDAGPGNGTLYNSLLTFIPDGTLANHHRKLMPTYTERLVWGLGDAAGVRAVETPVGRVGGLICWEHWMPLPRHALHESGEDLHIAAWPTVKEMNVVASRHYAFEGRCCVLAVGSLLRASGLPDGLVAHPDLVTDPTDWVVRGGSCIIGPDGDLLAGPVYDEETILTAEVDRARIREARMNLDVSGHYARPDCFRLERLEAGARRT